MSDPCLHPRISVDYRTSPTLRIITETCEDCGKILKHLEENIAPIRGIIDEAPLVCLHPRTQTISGRVGEPSGRLIEKYGLGAMVYRRVCDTCRADVAEWSE